MAEEDHAKTDAARVRRELDRSLVSGVAWSGAAKWTAQVVAWVSTLFVARLVTPADFGVVGMAWLYLGFVAVGTEFGIGSAVVTMRELSARQLHQLNTVAIALGVGAAGLSVALAVPLARFFDEPRLAAVVAVLSASALIAGSKVVPAALLQKELQFRRLAMFEGASAVIVALGTLGLAIAGLGYWALVFGSLAGAIVHVSLVVRSRPLPLGWPRGADIGPAVSFSRDMLVSRLSWYAYDNADFLIAGKVLGTSPLGAYRLAWTFASMPLDKLVSLVGRVTPAVLSSVQNDRAELRRYVLRITEAVSLAVFPASVGLALVADDFVQALLGDKWLAAVWPLRILAAYTCVRGVTPIWSQVLMVTGDTRFLMSVSGLGALTLPLGFWVGSHWGLIGIASAWVVLHPPVVVAPIYRRLSRRIDLPFAAFGRALMPAAKATALMTAVVVLVRFLTVGDGALVRLAAEVAAGCFAYAAAVAATSGGRLRMVMRSLRRGSSFSD